MSFTHATVYYNQGTEGRAKYIGAAFDYAYDYLRGQGFPTPRQSFALYVYTHRNDLIQGLVSISGVSQTQADWYRRTGATPGPGCNSSLCVQHIDPSFKWAEVTHELTHGFVWQYTDYASNYYIKWLDEGLAQTEAWRCLSTNPSHLTEARQLRDNAWATFLEMKTRGSLIKLSEMTYYEQWTNFIDVDQSRYSYSEAFVVAAYLVSTHGQGRVLQVTKSVQQTANASDALERVLGESGDGILDKVKKAPQPVIFQVPTITTTLVTTTSTVTSYTMNSTTLATTTQPLIPRITTIRVSGNITQQLMTVSHSTEEVTAARTTTSPVLVAGIIIVMTTIGMIVLYRRKRSRDKV